MLFTKVQRYNFFYDYLTVKFYCSTRLSGGGWAKPKNGEAHFWAWVGGAV